MDYEVITFLLRIGKNNNSDKSKIHKDKEIEVGLSSTTSIK